ncbi:ATP-binding protein, partial [Paracraurococcus ruber]|nr:ATP-binding protein [Paracraurococcus ruber]
DILAQLAAARPAAPAALPPPSAEQEAERRHAQLAVLAGLLAEPEAAYRPVAILQQEFNLRCRIGMLPGRPPDLAGFRRLLALARAGISAATEVLPAWPAVAAQADSLPEDLQAVYLLLARAALEGAPCPNDATIAEACGSRSLTRARRVLGFIEAQGAILLRPDAAGHRIVTLPGPGLETAPGDPEAVPA